MTDTLNNMLQKCAWEGDCLVYQPKISSHYPKIRYAGRIVYGHQAVFHNKHGKYPEIGRHICDNKKCLNEDHILEGTVLDNYEDAIRNGKVPARKVSVKEVLDSPLGPRPAARFFGVSTSVIQRIRKQRGST